MSLQNRAFGASTHVTKDAATPILAQVTDDGNITRTTLTAADGGDTEVDGLYYLYVVGTDSAGNPANANVTFADDDGLSTAGLGLTTGIYLDNAAYGANTTCLLYTSPSPRDRQKSRMPSSA